MSVEAATPLNSGSDPFSALTQRFAAMDVKQEATRRRTQEVLRNGKAAVSKLKQSAERRAADDTKTRLSIRQFTESDTACVGEIEEMVEKVEAERSLPVTRVLDPEEVRARLDAAAAAVSTPEE